LNAPIKVMHMIHDLKSEGAQTTVAELINKRDTTRIDCALLTLYEGGSALERGSYQAPVRRYCVHKHRGPDLRVFTRMHAAINEFKPDIVHTQCYILRYALPLLLTHREITIVHTVQNLAEKDCGRPHGLIRAAYKAGVVPVAVSNAVAESLAALHDVDPYKVIPNAVEVANWTKDPVRGDAFRLRFGLDMEQVVFVSVASLTAKKNHAGLLRAFRTLRDEVGGAVLLLAGSGDCRSDLELLAASLGIGADVIFLGAYDNVHELLCAADVFVLPSEREGLPLAVMEAMAAGLPIVSTAVGGVPEIVEDGHNGLLVDAGDEDGLAQAMITLAQDPNRRKAMGRAAVAAAPRFDVSHMVHSYEALYEELLAQRGRNKR